MFKNWRSYFPTAWWSGSTTIAPANRFRPFMGSTVDSGVEVTPETAQSIATVLACVTLISDDISGLPVRIGQRTAFGKRKVRDHYLYQVFDDPNEYHSREALLRIMMRSLLLQGSTYSLIKKIDGYHVEGIYPKAPWSVTPQIYQDGRFDYKIRNVEKPITPDRILHNVYLSDDGLIGKSPIQVAAQSVGIALAADKFAAKFYQRGTALTGYIKYPTGMDDPEAEAELKKSWLDNYAGVDNAHDVPILFDNAEFVPLSITPEQAQFLQSRQYQTVDICRLFRVNPVKIGDLSKSSYATYSAVMTDHVKSCLKPWITRLEQEFSRKLLSEEDKRAGLFIWLDPDGLMRGDRDSQDKSFATGKQFGWYSTNDIRDYLNLDPIDGGDEYLQPLNMAAAVEAEPIAEEPQNESDSESEPDPEAETNESPPNEQEQRRRDAERLNPLLHDSLKRMLVKEVNAVKRAATRGKDLIDWAEGWYPSHETLVASAILPALTAFESSTAHGKAADYATQHVEDSIKDIEDAVTFDALPELYDRWLSRRPYEITLETL